MWAAGRVWARQAGERDGRDHHGQVPLALPVGHAAPPSGQGFTPSGYSSPGALDCRRGGRLEGQGQCSPLPPRDPGLTLSPSEVGEEVGAARG